LEKYIRGLNEQDDKARRERDNARRRLAHAIKKGGPALDRIINDARGFDSLDEEGQQVRTMRPRKRGKGLEAVLPGANSVNGKEGRV
jgi:hypothetical protein